MRKFDCYKPDVSNFDVAYYCRQNQNQWYGFNKYGEIVRTINLYTNNHISDADILGWMRTQGGTIVDKPVYEEKFEPKLYLNVWNDNIWYILFTSENDIYTLYLLGKREMSQPHHRNHKEYLEYSQIIKPVLGDTWTWEEIKDWTKDIISKLVREKGTHKTFSELSCDY